MAIKEDRYFVFITFSVKIYTELCYREGQTDSTSVDIRQIFFRFELKRRSMNQNFSYIEGIYRGVYKRL